MLPYEGSDLDPLSMVLYVSSLLARVRFVEAEITLPDATPLRVLLVDSCIHFLLESSAHACVFTVPAQEPWVR